MKCAKLGLIISFLAVLANSASATKISGIKSRSVFEGEAIVFKVKGKIKQEKNPLEVKFLDFVNGVETEFGGTPTVEISKKGIVKVTAPSVSNRTRPLTMQVKRANEEDAEAARVSIIVFNTPDNATNGPAGADGTVSATDVSANSLKLGDQVTLSANGDSLLFNNETLIYTNTARRLKIPQIDLSDFILENKAGALTWNGHTILGSDGIQPATSLNDGQDPATTLSISGETAIGLKSGGRAVSVTLPPTGVIKGMVVGKYDFAIDGGTAGTITLRESNLPNNAVITRAWYEVITTLRSATDNTNIGIGIPTNDVNGIVAQIQILNVSNPWDQGFHEAIQDGSAINFANKTSAERNLQLTLTGENLIAGKMNVFAEYVISE